MSIKKHIAILQPEIPHYRIEFFSLLRERLERLDVYVYNSRETTLQQGLHLVTNDFTYITNRSIKGVLFYDLLPLLSKRYDTLVLMLHRGHFTTWLLLLTKFIHRKRLILWGHGISVHRYLNEEKKVSLLMKWMIGLADGVWLYTEKETAMWKKIFPDKPIVSLNNTISGGEEKTSHSLSLPKEKLREKYGIREKLIILFCARFSSADRKAELLLECIKQLDKNKFGFVIIGDGPYKPAISNYQHVHDMGSVYDDSIKSELFLLADIYFQPAWVGLSIVEAMAYGLPIFTLKRTEEIKQCVEYSYLRDGYNGRIFDDLDSLVQGLNGIQEDCILQMGENARTFVKENLTMHHMVNAAMSIL